MALLMARPELQGCRPGSCTQTALCAATALSLIQAASVQQRLQQQPRQTVTECSQAPGLAAEGALC